MAMLKQTFRLSLSKNSKYLVKTLKATGRRKLLTLKFHSNQPDKIGSLHSGARSMQMSITRMELRLTWLTFSLKASLSLRSQTWSEKSLRSAPFSDDNLRLFTFQICKILLVAIDVMGFWGFGVLGLLEYFALFFLWVTNGISCGISCVVLWVSL